MKRLLFLLLTLAIVLLCLAGCGIDRTLVLDEAKTYEITSQVRSLDIRINAADLKIEYADAFSVGFNSVSEPICIRCRIYSRDSRFSPYGGCTFRLRRSRSYSRACRPRRSHHSIHRFRTAYFSSPAFSASESSLSFTVTMTSLANLRPSNLPLFAVIATLVVLLRDYGDRYYGPLEHMPQHGFYYGKEVARQDTMSFRPDVRLCAELGWSWALTKEPVKIGAPILQVGAFVEYGILNPLKRMYNTSLLSEDFYNPYMDVKMNHVYTTLNREQTTINNLRVGVRVAVLFPVAKGKNPFCRCIDGAATRYSL